MSQYLVFAQEFAYSEIDELKNYIGKDKWVITFYSDHIEAYPICQSGVLNYHEDHISILPCLLINRHGTGVNELYNASNLSLSMKHIIDSLEIDYEVI